MKNILILDDAYPIINKLIKEMQSFFDNEIHWAHRFETIEIIESKLSPLHAFVRLFTDYANQVINNGHEGYFTNGTHSSQQAGCMDEVRLDDDLLQKLLELAKLHAMKLDAPSEIQKLIAILGSIQLEVDEEDYIEDTCDDCLGIGYILADNENEEACFECEGSGWIEVDNPEKGRLTHDCKNRCQLADTQLMEIYNQIIISIANRTLMDNEQ